MSRHTAVAMMASLNERPKTTAYVPMREKLSRVKLPSAVEKA